MNTDNLVFFNFVFSVVLAFMMYRQYVVGGFRRQKEVDGIHQEIRNQMEYVNGRLDNFEDRMDRDMIEVYRDLDHLKDQQPKKKTTGLNSRIPL
jgi:hypothetical protein